MDTFSAGETLACIRSTIITIKITRPRVRLVPRHAIVLINAFTALAVMMVMVCTATLLQLQLENLREASYTTPQHYAKLNKAAEKKKRTIFRQILFYITLPNIKLDGQLQSQLLIEATAITSPPTRTKTTNSAIYFIYNCLAGRIIRSSWCHSVLGFWDCITR